MDKYIGNSILDNQILPFIIKNMRLRWTFHLDNDPKHTSTLIKFRFDTNKIIVMQRHAQSPDLNPIENLWKQLEDKVRLHGRFRNAEELYQELQTEWSQRKQVQIDNLIEPMPQRCR